MIHCHPDATSVPLSATHRGQVLLPQHLELWRFVFKIASRLKFRNVSGERRSDLVSLGHALAIKLRIHLLNWKIPWLPPWDQHGKSLRRCWHPSWNETQQRDPFQTRRDIRPQMCHLSSGLPADKWSYTSLIWKEDIVVIHSFVVSSALRQIHCFFHNEGWR
jgi:hypothetical protein